MFGGILVTEMTATKKLESLGITLPVASNPQAKYSNFVIVNGLMFVSGKGPFGNPKGKLGKDYTTEEGYKYARETGIEILAVLKQALGSLDKVKRCSENSRICKCLARF